MQKYTIILPNEKAKTYRYVTLFILIINLLLFGFIYFSASEKRLANLCLIGTVVSFAALFMIIINRFTKNRYPFMVEIPFFISTILWFLIGKYLLALCIICVAIMGNYTRRKFEVFFIKEGIIYPSFPKKTFLWNDISNVILKDGMLTIDLKNNRLIQSVISKESVIAVNEKEFNSFCRERLLDLEMN